MADTSDKLREAARKRDAQAHQELLDTHVLFVVSINPELRVKVARGPAIASLGPGRFHAGAD
jgi:hypothetical protein